MKRWVIAVFIAGMFLLAARAPVKESKPKIKTVETQEGHLREGPGYSHRLVTTVPLGQRLRELEKKWDFLHVEGIEVEAAGWIHESQVTHLELFLDRSDEGVKRRLKREETLIAARSFWEEVEKSLRRGKAKNETGYARLDSLVDDPRFDPEMEAIARFREAGGLRPLGEG